MRRVSIIVVIVFIVSCGSNSEYKEYKTNNVLDYVTYKMYHTESDIKRGISPVSKFKISKDQFGRLNLITISGKYNNINAEYQYLCYGGEEDKGDYILDNGMITRLKISEATKTTDVQRGTIHFLYKYYIGDKIALIKDKNIFENTWHTIILDKRMFNVN